MTKAAAYLYSPGEKLRSAFTCLRQVAKPATNLIAGPFAGEFGYELMQWQAYVRARRPRYQQVHVITYPGRDYLYEGCRVHYHSIPLDRAGHWYGLLDPQAGMAMADAKARELSLRNYDVFSPALLCTQYHKRLFWRQEFRLFHETPLEKSPHDVAFHFRRVDKEGEHPKNYPEHLARQLVDRCRACGLAVMCIGHPEYSFCTENAEDCRTIDLRETVRAISGVRLVSGANSGPMHLANLCGKPTVLWAISQHSIDFSLRWNPFRVPIYLAANDTHQPSPELVCDRVLDALRDLGARTNAFTKPPYLLPAQQIAYY